MKVWGGETNVGQEMREGGQKIDCIAQILALRGGFKTQPPVDRRFRPVPGGCHCLEQKKPGGTAGQPAVGF